MERSTLEAFVWGLPLIDAAREDAINRGLAHFEHQDPSPTELQTWGESLRERAPHFFAPPAQSQSPSLHTMVPDWLPPAERLAMARQMGQAVVHDKAARRPQPYTPTPEQLRSLEGKSPTERLNMYREWQAEAQTGQR